MDTPQKRTKSYSCLSIQKQLQKDQRSKSKGQFVPFCSERRLGKLITQKREDQQPKATQEQLLNRINFKNFQQVYKIVSDFQNKKYSQTTRKPQQRNLINKEWRVVSIKKLPERPNCTPRSVLSIQKPVAPPIPKSQFQKADLQLYKKLSSVGEPTDNPELQQLYRSYIEVVEMNENIRREQLTGRALR